MFRKKHDFRGDKSQSKKNKFLLFFVKDERLYINDGSCDGSYNLRLGVAV